MVGVIVVDGGRVVGAAVTVLRGDEAGYDGGVVAAMMSTADGYRGPLTASMQAGMRKLSAMSPMCPPPSPA